MIITLFLILKTGTQNWTPYLLIFYFYLLKFYLICLVYTFTNYSNKICLEDNTERSESNPGRSLGTTTKKKRGSSDIWSDDV